MLPRRGVSLGRKVNILSVRREREEAEQEGRPIQEEEHDDENIQSPFQPIENVISEVSCHCVHLRDDGLLLWLILFRLQAVFQQARGIHVLFRMKINKRKRRGKKSYRRAGITAPRQVLIKRRRRSRIQDKHQKTTLQVSFRMPGSSCLETESC